ncbi:TadE-like protein [Pirellulimonas nuda]|uniref:TadE-like protein n=1 Tax=Pirellulimonas nuda TaxID=2528009 RepID=A0A518D9J8_9BACT|nr:TadE family protein [Pirellulimonas nuda]QDU88162.1 TadE-like protein [Pirellulimonas nuda]
MKHPIRQIRSGRRGIAATEFAVCLPVLMLLLLGMLEACSMIFIKQSLASAAYEGAHTAVAPGATATDVRRACLDLLTDRRVRGASVSVLPGDPLGVPEGQFMEVHVSAGTDANSLLPLRFFRGRTLTASASMMKEI